MNLYKLHIFTIVVSAVFASVVKVKADDSVQYEVGVTGVVSSGDFAPYHIASLNNGRFTQAQVFQTELSVWKEMDASERFSYGFGIEVVGSREESTAYRRFDGESKSWFSHKERPSSFWIHQLYGEAKYRGLFLEAGLKEQSSNLLNQRLSSGDLIESGNTRPMPQLRAGFNDFQNIPLTGGWFQIYGEAAFGCMLDDGWWRDHYNYYDRHIVSGQLYNYKCVYFRTKPEMSFSATFGMQAAAFFGGETKFYYDGVLSKSVTHSRTLKYFVKMMFPLQDGGDGFYSGSHLGTWDIRLRYRLKNGDKLYAYTSWLWEDGSGIGRLNGWDGLWGLEYEASKGGLVKGALIEYFDFTNQSGPIHFVPDDYPGCTLPGHVSGADDYYNNATYSSFAYYGMSLGTPVMMSPIYNLNGYVGYVGNAVRGFHVGIEGALTSRLDYRIKGSRRKAWGTAKIMLDTPLHLNSLMVETSWRPAKVDGLTVDLGMELDRGNMPSNAFGVMLGVRYDGVFGR